MTCSNRYLPRLQRAVHLKPKRNRYHLLKRLVKWMTG